MATSPLKCPRKTGADRDAAQEGRATVTVEVDRPSLQRQGDDAAMAGLVDEMQRGEIQALILHGVNPVYDYVDGAGFLKGGRARVAARRGHSPEVAVRGVAVRAVVAGGEARQRPCDQHQPT